MWLKNLAMGLASQTATGLVNNALARGPAQEQRDWQEKMWRQQNEYNTPSAMAGRMRSAGLNPYALTGAEPAGSAGSGVKADFIPIQDPLSVSRQIADIENIRAATGKTLSETEKLIQEASNLQVAYEKGLIEKQEYDFRFNKLKEAWNESNPYKLENENKAADTELKKSQTASTQVDADNKQREYDDQHNESIARVDKIRQDISSSINSMINDNIRLDTELEKHDIYKRFAELDYKEQEQLVMELLETWDVRESLINSDKGVRTMLVNQLERSNELQIEKHKYDMAVAKSIANAIENGESVDAVLLKALAENPTSALALTTQLVSTIVELGTDVVKSQNEKKLVSGAYRH